MFFFFQIASNSNSLPCSCLENPRDGGAWWAAVYGVAQSRTWLKRLSKQHRSFFNKTRDNSTHGHHQVNTKIRLIIFFAAFSSSFLFASVLFFAICKASSGNHFASFHFFFLGLVSITDSCTMSWTSIHSSSGTLSDLISWIYLSLALYNTKGFDLSHTLMV